MDVQDDKMVVQVQDELTTDQWRNTFDCRHIEELTHKTGNFKQFKVFINMLESAINKVSDSVSLELLTYSDLEKLRQRKTVHSKGYHNHHSSTDTPTKQYLILTYSSEFDRIHYPLALPYKGKSDPVQLQEIIKQLKKELNMYKKQKYSSSSSLQRKYESLLHDKENLESAYEELHEEMKGHSGRGYDKEIRGLKKVIKNLEENNLKEKNKHQRIIIKKNEEIKNLIEEVEELRASERLLTSRVKNLTNEIGMLKRNPVSYRSRGYSGSDGGLPRHRHRSSSHEERASVHSRYRSSSAEGSSKPTHIRHRSSSLEGRVSNSNIRKMARTPSPRNKVFKRFDPTNYVLNKQKRQEEIDKKLKRNRSRSCSSERNRIFSKPPSSAVITRKIDLDNGNTLRSRTSSVGSRSSSCCPSSVECSGDDEYLIRSPQHTKENKIIKKRSVNHFIVY
jgi:coiled-coil domain-containing protein 61